MRSSTRRLYHGGLLLFCASLAGCSSEPPPSEPPPPKVTVGHPEERKNMVDADDYNGWLEASEKVEVRSRVRGAIQEVFFTDGEIVKKDAPLFDLDPEPFKAEIAQSEAQREIFVAQKEAAVKEQLRLEELLTKGGASKRQVEKAQADVKALEAQILAGDNDVKRKKLDLKYSHITAEIGGRIDRALLTKGNQVNATGTDLLTTIYAVDPIYVYFNIDERSLRRYAKRAGIQKKNFTELLAAMKEQKLPFKFRLETDEGFPFSGELNFVGARIDPSTGTVQARGQVGNTKGELVLAHESKVRIDVTKPYTGLLVPDTAVLTDQDKKYVLLVNDKNIVQRRDINPGKLLDDGMRVVLPGENKEENLTAKDWIVVEGLQRARLNYPVDPVKPSGAAE